MLQTYLDHSLISRETLVFSWLPTSSAVPLTTTTVPPAMGPKVGVTLLIVGSTAVKESTLTMATLEPMARENSLSPPVTKLVVSQTNWCHGIKLMLRGEQATPPNVRADF